MHPDKSFFFHLQASASRSPSACTPSNPRRSSSPASRRSRIQVRTTMQYWKLVELRHRNKVLRKLVHEDASSWLCGVLCFSHFFPPSFRCSEQNQFLMKGETMLEEKLCKTIIELKLSESFDEKKISLSFRECILCLKYV